MPIVLLNVRLPMRMEPHEISCGREWRLFENLLRSCLAELGHHVVEWDGTGTEPDADCSIHAHRCRCDGPGDLFYKQMHLCEAFTLDSEGWGVTHSGLQSKPRLDGIDVALARNFSGGWSRRALHTGISKHSQPSIGLPLDLPPHYVFVPLQLPGDYVQTHHSPLSITAFVRLVSEWANNSGKAIVIKPHPGNSRNPEVLECVDECSKSFRNVFVSSGNVHELIAASHGVVTINSGVGFESLVHGKPVAVMGNCDYKWVAHCSGNLDQAAEFFERYTPDQRLEAWCFVYYYCFIHSYFVTWDRLPQLRKRMLHQIESALSVRLQENLHWSKP
jgi:Capsule polysaccharide biosynthesis protein